MPSWNLLDSRGGVSDGVSRNGWDLSVRRTKFPFLSRPEPFRVLSSFKQALSNLFFHSPTPPVSLPYPFYIRAHTLPSPHFTFYHLSVRRSVGDGQFVYSCFDAQNIFPSLAFCLWKICLLSFSERFVSWRSLLITLSLIFRNETIRIWTHTILKVFSGFSGWTRTFTHHLLSSISNFFRKIPNQFFRFTNELKCGLSSNGTSRNWSILIEKFQDESESSKNWSKGIWKNVFRLCWIIYERSRLCCRPFWQRGSENPVSGDERCFAVRNSFVSRCTTGDLP